MWTLGPNVQSRLGKLFDPGQVGRVVLLSRNSGFSDATSYKWRAKFGGMQVSEAQRLRELESESAKLKRLLAEAHLDMHALKRVLGVKR